MFKDKPCKVCGATFTPTAPCNLVCSDECKKELTRQHRYKKWCKKVTALGRAHVIGVGRGGSALKFKDNPLYKNGIGNFHRLRKVVKERGDCERCGVDLRDVSPYSWACHHKEHDRTNNVIENLELLCKRCHQIEHECWKAFEGVTTIPKGSRAKQPEAPCNQNG